MASPKPAVIVRREFEATPEVVTQQLRACIVGPACQLVRYNKSAEKSKGLVETVASITPSTIGGGLLYAANAFKTIPNLAYSSVLDVNSVKVFIDDAYLTYADLADDGDFRSAAGAQSNALVLNATAWKATTRNSGLVQDVAVGDIVQIYTGSAVLNKTTKVQGFTAEVVAGNIGAGTFTGAAAYSTTIPGTVAAGGLTFGLSSSGAFDTDAEQVADPRRAGKRFTTYTVAITSFDGTNLGVSVTSDTGLDSIAGSLVANGILTLPSGATVTAPASFPSVTIGGSGSFTYGPVQVVYAAAGQSATPAAATVTTTAGAPTAGLTKDTTYYVTCISGGAVKSTAGCTFRVSTNNGADVVSTINVAGVTNITGATKTIGSYGISLNFGVLVANTFTGGFVKGDSFSIVVTAASAGIVKTLIVADPYTIATAITSVRLSKQVSLEVNQLQADAATTNWVLTSPTDADLRGVTISSAPKMRHSSVNSGLTDCRITAGKVYFQYRSFLAISPEVGSATTLADITAQLGPIDPANDLAYGVYKAWSNANGATVHFIPTQSSDLNGTNGFAAALDLAKGNRNCYSLVPLSTSAEVWNAFVGHANDESAPATGRFRIVWIAPEVNKHNKIQDSPIGDASTILTASSSAVGGGQTGKYYVTSALDSRFGETARVGDYIRTKFEPTATGGESYVEYRVTAVVDNTTLVISAAVDPSLVSQRIQLFRDLSASELATEYVKVSGSFSSERVFAVIPDRGVNGFRVDGVPVKNWYVACAFAGLRAGSRPHQPLSNVELLGFDGSNDTVMAFNETNLDTLRDGGCWVVRNAEDGTVYAERQLSTSTLDIYRKEQSVTCNIDSIAFSVADGLRNLVGRINITPNTLQVVSVNLQAIMDTFLNKTGSATIGAQLLSYTITSVSVPATAKDTVLVRLAVTLPVPMNVIDITIVI